MVEDTFENRLIEDVFVFDNIGVEELFKELESKSQMFMMKKDQKNSINENELN